MFEFSKEQNRYIAMHHPFTCPNLEEVQFMHNEKDKVHSRAYDLVLNGSEIGGGSIRIHDNKLQSEVFKALGFSEKEAEEKFGFLLNAFKYGAPPHAGCAFGFDRLVMIFGGTDNIRDVIAFPKTNSAASPMDGSPGKVDLKQVKELHLSLNIQDKVEEN